MVAVAWLKLRRNPFPIVFETSGDPIRLALGLTISRDFLLRADEVIE
jgi:hypothetical protein